MTIRPGKARLARIVSAATITALKGLNPREAHPAPWGQVRSPSGLSCLVAYSRQTGWVFSLEPDATYHSVTQRGQGRPVLPVINRTARRELQRAALTWVRVRLLNRGRLLLAETALEE